MPRSFFSDLIASLTSTYSSARDVPAAPQSPANSQPAEGVNKTGSYANQPSPTTSRPFGSKLNLSKQAESTKHSNASSATQAQNTSSGSGSFGQQLTVGAGASHRITAERNSTQTPTPRGNPAPQRCANVEESASQGLQSTIEAGAPQRATPERKLTPTPTPRRCVNVEDDRIPTEWSAYFDSRANKIQNQTPAFRSSTQNLTSTPNATNLKNQSASLQTSEIRTSTLNLTSIPCATDSKVQNTSSLQASTSRQSTQNVASTSNVTNSNPTLPVSNSEKAPPLVRTEKSLSNQQQQGILSQFDPLTTAERAYLPSTVNKKPSPPPLSAEPSLRSQASLTDHAPAAKNQTAYVNPILLTATTRTSTYSQLPATLPIRQSPSPVQSQTTPSANAPKPYSPANYQTLPLNSSQTPQKQAPNSENTSLPSTKNQSAPPPPYLSSDPLTRLQWHLANLNLAEDQNASAPANSLSPTASQQTSTYSQSQKSVPQPTVQSQTTSGNVPKPYSPANYQTLPPNLPSQSNQQRIIQSQTRAGGSQNQRQPNFEHTSLPSTKKQNARAEPSTHENWHLPAFENFMHGAWKPIQKSSKKKAAALKQLLETVMHSKYLDSWAEEDPLVRRIVRARVERFVDQHWIRPGKISNQVNSSALGSNQAPPNSVGSRKGKENSQNKGAACRSLTLHNIAHWQPNVDGDYDDDDDDNGSDAASQVSSASSNRNKRRRERKKNKKGEREKKKGAAAQNQNPSNIPPLMQAMSSPMIQNSNANAVQLPQNNNFNAVKQPQNNNFNAAKLPQNNNSNSNAAKLPQNNNSNSHAAKLPQNNNSNSHAAKLPQNNNSNSNAAKLPQNNNSNSNGKKPANDGELRNKLIGIVDTAQDDWFYVEISEGPYQGRRLRCYTRQLADTTIPIIPAMTRIQLDVKIRHRPSEDELIIILFLTILDYIGLKIGDVRKAIYSALDYTHEEFIKKIYFTWKPFYKAMLTYTKEFNKEILELILFRILPSEEDWHHRWNKHHESQFREIVEIFASDESTFLRRMSEVSIEKVVAKRLVEFITLYVKKLDPVCCLLDKYYSNNPSGLIDLIKSCCKQIEPKSEYLATQNFRDVPLIPVMEELTGVISSLVMGSSVDATVQRLLQVESHLVPNRIDEPWDTPEQFLNVHFRLLREECFASIRNRIANNRLDPGNFQHVHRDVKVIGYAISDGTIIAKLKYTPHKSRTNMMFGNLLCIDVDMNFSNPIWATVQSTEMKGNVIGVNLVGVGNNYIDTNGNDVDGLISAEVLVSALLRLFSGQSGVMVESPTYYHAFKPVLARLQELDDDEFPFESEILLHSKSPQESTVFTTYDVSGYENKKMDDSQVAAADEALNSRFTLIQGPPGCGKTFVGKEIIREMLKTTRGDGPILIMTYKNHALDSMLEGCLEFTKSVVRIGGKSASEVISQYNLHNLFKEIREHCPVEDFKELQQAKGQLREIQDELRIAASKAMTDFTPATLLRFLQKDDTGNQQLRSLLHRNFLQNYSQIIDQKDLKYSPQQIDATLTDILNSEDSQLTEKLINLSLKQWLSEVESVKYLPTPGESLFMKQDSKSKPAKVDADDEEDREEVLEEEDWVREYGERRVGSDSKLDFVDLSQPKGIYRKLQGSLANTPPDQRERNVITVGNVWSLTPVGRSILLSFWIRECSKVNDTDLAQALENYRKFHEQVKSLEDGRNVNFLRSRDIVACTITGCCIRMGLISQLEPLVVIVEEAAEILEAQLIAALPSSVEHVVLIGDHLQLPPQVNHFRLAKRFNMAVSIFERLAKNGYPVAQLTYHRRGPQLLCPLFSRFYQQQIVAMKGDPQPPMVLRKLGIMYWWSHNFPAKTAGGTSFENEMEALMIVGMVRFLIWQKEVKADKISIIAGYLGQARTIKTLLAKYHVEGVAVCTVDRFQGDENDIILLSLTRSSGGNIDDTKPPSLGFLGSKNRTCVALSRARKCLYIFGCSNLFKTHPVWKETVGYFESRGKLGNELEFVNEGKSIIFEHPQDFAQFFKRIDLQTEAMKRQLQNEFTKDLPAGMKEGVHDVTKEFKVRLEDLMNDSVLDKNDLGRGRDAHGNPFKRFEVTKVFQIFNRKKYILYLHHQKEIEDKKPPPLGFDLDSAAHWTSKMLNKKVNEAFLFHGTNADVAQLIMDGGFDERLANCGMFGVGTYFAENADKSDQYIARAPYQMFLARVTLGNPYKTVQTGNWRRPPAINPAKPNELFDSIVAVSQRKAGYGSVSRHQEFVIFNRFQCLPEFLIEYKRK